MARNNSRSIGPEDPEFQSFIKEDLGDVPDLSTAVRLVVATVETLHQQWNPVESGMNEQIYVANFGRSFLCATLIYSKSPGGHLSDCSELGMQDIPRVEVVLPLLTRLMEDCRFVWPAAKFDHERFVDMVNKLTFYIAWRAYRDELNQSDRVSDLEIEIDRHGEPLTLFFSKEELDGSPHVGAILEILAPAVVDCTARIQAITDFSDMTAYLNSFTDIMESAAHDFLSSEWRDRPEAQHVVPSPADHLVQDTAPVLVEVFQHCRSVWSQADYESSIFVSMVMIYMVKIATKLHQNGIDGAV